jgi:protein arginine kinase activator
MLCDHCSEKEATVHLTQVIEGEVKKLHLCEQCAAESGFDVHGTMSVTDILLGMGGEVTTPASVESMERSCPVCHLRRSDFKKTGQFGCPACYATFADELKPLLKAIHHGEQHTGKVPAREGVRVRMSAQLANLQQALDQAVGEEKYEEAAGLRDQIRECQRAIAEEEKAEK